MGLINLKVNNVHGNIEKANHNSVICKLVVLLSSLALEHCVLWPSLTSIQNVRAQWPTAHMLNGLRNFQKIPKVLYCCYS